MEGQDYDIWAMRLNQAIRSVKEGEPNQGEKPDAPSTKDLMLGFSREAAAIVGAIGRNIDDVEVHGNDRGGAMEGFLDEMLRFEEFSFLEFRYEIPSNRQPGLRFKLETHGEAKQIVVHYFEDLIFWPVDEAGERIFFEPIRFDLGGGKIMAFPHPDWGELYAGCTDWRSALRETLTIPFRYLYGEGDPYPR